MERRDFLQQSAAGAAFSILAPGLLYSQSAEKAKVALVKTGDRARGVAAAIKLLTFPSPKGKKVLIKPNFNTADPTPGSTHNDTLRQLVLEMQARGAAHITVGERSGPPPTESVIEAKSIPAMAQELGFDVINFKSCLQTAGSISTRRETTGRTASTLPGPLSRPSIFSGRVALKRMDPAASSACRSSWPWESLQRA